MAQSVPINIDNLARLARERNDDPSWRSLWNAVIRLPAWYGVTTLERPDAPALLLAGEPPKPRLFAFTDERRAWRFVNQAPRPVRAPDGSRVASVIRMPLPQAIRYAAALGQRGVEHVVFNAGHGGAQGFGFPVAALAQLAAALGRPASPAPSPTPEQPPAAAGEA